ncbi:MAG TPA: hypothetical protein VJB16_00225, partial [archaeon]|nr:hypothetical protein [archaeon]
MVTQRSSGGGIGAQTPFAQRWSRGQLVTSDHSRHGSSSKFAQPRKPFLQQTFGPGAQSSTQGRISGGGGVTHTPASQTWPSAQGAVTDH